MVIGIDEVGRGCWAGPLVAAAVVLPDNHQLVGLNDSKLLSKKKRDRLDILIRDIALSYGVGWVSSNEVDKLGLTEAIRLAMQRAIDQIDYHDQEIIIDGNINYLNNLTNTKAVVKADLTIPSVSAASIIAKVARDKYMQSSSLKYPEYYFEKHVGYGTALHRTALEHHGISKIHRRSFSPMKSGIYNG